MRARLPHLLYGAALAIGLGLLYALGLNNQLVFDDGRLTDGSIFSVYGQLWPLKPRALSYASFVWVQDIVGEGWWKQRVVNLALHVGTAWALYALTLSLLQRVTPSQTTPEKEHVDVSTRNASMLAVALWAFSPAAVYAVGYLVQRSIVMATLLVVIACWAWVRGMQRLKWPWLVGAVLAYAAAVAAKEHAVAAVLLFPLLYVYVRRPPLSRLVPGMLAAGALLAGMASLLYMRYGSIIGTVFDETSRAFAVQLEQQQPGISAHLYPLSIVNQATLFFRYGLLWVLPYVGWMSIDLRPAFPLSLLSVQGAGALVWLALLVGAGLLAMQRRDQWSLVGLGLVIPVLLFLTEFATVWLQDPFVLYRSYLWSIGLPLLLAVSLVSLGGRKAMVLALLLVAVLAGLSAERLSSLQSPSSVWRDAADKIDRQASANAVGRWRPFLNLASEAQERGLFDEALRLAAQAEALGEPMGSARFNMGVSLHQLRKYDEAVGNFSAAEAKGFTEAGLYYQRGEALFALGRFAPAADSFSTALQHKQVAEAERFTRLRLAEAATGAQQWDRAVSTYRQLTLQAPDKPRYQIGLAMAYVGAGSFDAALQILDAMIATRPSGQAYYARALLRMRQGQKAASQQDLQQALALEPNNPQFHGLKRVLEPPMPLPAPGRNKP